MRWLLIKSPPQLLLWRPLGQWGVLNHIILGYQPWSAPLENQKELENNSLKKLNYEV